ncbi:MAG TPA: MBL fold metallo-hydrolase [Candidatus Omnitrophota bacterium]|nr:MBL fold metallo-hydrolase [Candidatus Omnitrophota bacterium]
MKVTLVADSAFIFEHDGIRILTDPWIGTTIYGGAWMQYPPPVIKPEEVGRLDYIFISHIHEDHCCSKTIAKLDRNAKIILMDKKPNYVVNFLRYFNFEFADVILLKPREVFRVSPSLAFEVIEADPAHELNHLIDSSLLIHYGDKSIYFANDNPPYPGIYEYLKQYNFELALVPPAGGSGYPAFYKNLSLEFKKKRAAQILKQYQNTMVECLRAIRPKYFMCSASSHVLSGKNYLKNYEMSWAENPNAPYVFLSENLQAGDKFLPLNMKPGTVVDLDHAPGVSLKEAVAFYDDKKGRDEFIAHVASKVPYCFESLSLSPLVNFEHLLKLAHQRFVSALTRANANIDWVFQIKYAHSKVATFYFKPPYGLHFDLPVFPEKRIICEMDERLLYLLLTGGFSWNIADASGFLTYDRVPDEYIYDMYIYMNHIRI